MGNMENMKVYNILGDEVSFELNSSGELASLKLQTEKSGMYLLILQDGDEVMKTTLIKHQAIDHKHRGCSFNGTTSFILTHFIWNTSTLNATLIL